MCASENESQNLDTQHSTDRHNKMKRLHCESEIRERKKENKKWIEAANESRPYSETGKIVKLQCAKLDNICYYHNN